MLSPIRHPASIEAVRYHVRVRGQVQGVGFRPAVYRWAAAQGLTGCVYNDTHGAVVEVEGPAERVEAFLRGLAGAMPRLVRIDYLHHQAVPIRGDTAFIITPSRDSVVADAAVTVDTAVCDACLHEMRSPQNRRHGHALINCTDCGPRFSIIDAVPYDRPNTTMRRFAMCDLCRVEYDNPADRRFHAQPVCCPDCGPRVTLINRDGVEVVGSEDDPPHQAAEWLRAGKILAIKGIGGFHLAVRAGDADAVARLRQCKHRDAKPFAVMVRDVLAARALVQLTEAGEAALQGPAAPIVLAPRLGPSSVAPGLAAEVVPEVAPGTHRLGVMLPYTPIHHRLFDAQPQLGPLVMTSGNLSDEPLVTGNDEALNKLRDIADGLLMHNRPIARGVDDSVVLDLATGPPVLLRRSRGWVPTAIALDGGREAAAAPGLCVGGELKGTIAVVRRGEAVLGQHLGDLKHPAAYDNFRRSVDDMLGLFDVEPAWVACDRHPAYLSHGFAQRWAKDHGIALIEVQHHHAHAAALLAEHDRHDPILAFVADGVGYGDGGAVWGGEVLRVDRRNYQHLARLRPLRLPGGDAAARDTRRCALALLHQAYGDAGLDHPVVDSLGFEALERQTLSAMVRRRIHCVDSSALGRVFDGVAALLGLCQTNRFEAEAPMALEASAFAGDHAADTDTDACIVSVDTTPWAIDLSPLVRRLVDGRMRCEPTPNLAAYFHTGLARAWATLLRQLASDLGLNTIGLTGGVFANESFTLRVSHHLTDAGLTVLRHRQVPPNDGGLSLGQAAVAVACSVGRRKD
ncbi:MAG: carbamoyltransferase HypF [Planctomycetota bacterium]